MCSKRISLIIRLSLIVAFSLGLFLPPKASASDPMDQVKQSTEEIRKIFKEMNRPDQKEERNAKLRAIVRDRFDLEEMSKRALARYWRDRTPEQKKEFVALFSDLLENIYLKKIKKHEGEVQKHENDRVLYLDERIDDSYASVRTKIITYTGKEIPVEYKLLRKDGKWKAYDVVIEGVSLIGNYRTQFNQIIRSSSYGDLIKRMRAKEITAP